MAKEFQQLSDEQGGLIHSLMDLNLPLQRSIPRSDLRQVWNSLLFVLTQGCRWFDLPRDFDQFVPKSTAHDWLKQWSQTGTFNKVMSGLLQVGLKQGHVDFSHMAVDSSFSSCPWRWTASRPWI